MKDSSPCDPHVLFSRSPTNSTLQEEDAHPNHSQPHSIIPIASTLPSPSPPLVDATFTRQSDLCSFINQEIHIQLTPGQVLWLKGPSGVGKSTIVNLLLGLRKDPKIQSNISWNPSIPTSERAGILFQHGVMIDSLSVAENIQLALAVARKPSKLTNVDPLLRSVGLSLDRDGEKQPNHLSGGMHRRAALAQTLAQNKRLVVLDEPFTGLDEGVANEVLELIHEMRVSHGVAFILITHEPHIIRRMMIDKELELFPSAKAIYDVVATETEGTNDRSLSEEMDKGKRYAWDHTGNSLCVGSATRLGPNPRLDPSLCLDSGMANSHFTDITSVTSEVGGGMMNVLEELRKSSHSSGTIHENEDDLSASYSPISNITIGVVEDKTRDDKTGVMLHRSLGIESGATLRDTISTTNDTLHPKDAIANTNLSVSPVSPISPSSLLHNSAHNPSPSLDATYKIKIDKAIKENPSKAAQEELHSPIKLRFRRLLNRRWPWRRDKDVSRFILRTCDYFFISLPLIIICFIALGLSVSVLFADVLAKLDPVELIARTPGDLGETFSRLVEDDDIKKMIREGFEPFKEDLFSMFVSFVFIVEMAPLVTALILSGRIGGSFAGELATLRATKQETLLRTLGITMTRWIRVPSYLAAILSIPLLTCIGGFTALLTGSVVGKWRLNSDSQRYWELVNRFLFETQSINPNFYMWPWLIILYRSTGFAILIILSANLIVSMKKEVHPKHVARLITFAIVLSGVICLFADYGFNSVLENSSQGFKFLQDADPEEIYY